MTSVERRAFMKGAAVGALAFTVGGAEVLLTPGEARAHGVPLRLLQADEADPSRRWAKRWCPAPAQAGIAHFVDHQLSVPPRRRCSRHGSSMCGRRSRTSTAPRSAPSIAPAKRGTAPFAQLTADEQREFINLMRQARSTAGRARPAAVYFVMRSDAVDVVYGTMEGYDALGIPYMPHIAPEGEVVTWRRTKKSTSPSSAPAPPARSCGRAGQGRQEGRDPRAGPDWELTDLDQLGFLGTPDQAGGRARSCSKARTRSATAIKPAGAPAAR